MATSVPAADPGGAIATGLGLSTPDLQLAIALLYYLLVFIGSMPLGYLVARFTYSEVRTFSHSRKLMYALVLGFLIALSAIAGDYLAFADQFLQFNSAYMFFMFASTLVFFLVLRIYFVVQAASRQFVTIGIPLPRPSSGVSQPKARKAIEISKKIEEVKAQIQQTQQVQVQLPLPEKPREVKVKIEQVRDRSRELELSREKEKAKAEAERERKAKEFIEREKQRELEKLAGEKFKLEEKLRLELKKHEEEIRKREAQATKEMTPVELTIQVDRAVSGSAIDWASQREKPLEKKPRGAKVKEEAKAKQLLPVAHPAAPVVAVPREVEKKSGLFGFLFGSGKTETKQDKSGIVSWRGKKPSPQAKQLPEKQDREKEEREIEDLIGSVAQEAREQEVDEGKPVHRRYLLKENVQVKAPVHAVESEEFPGLIQDAYVRLQEAKEEKKAKVEKATPLEEKVEKQVPKLKEEKQQVVPARHVESPSIQPAKVETGVSISDILGTDLFSAKPAVQVPLPEATPAEHDIFGKLNELAEGKTQTPQVSLVDIKAPGAGCPTCHSSNSKIIFCPYCGGGMCANCSPSIKPLGDGRFIYTCPKCGEEVDVHKK